MLGLQEKEGGSWRCTICKISGGLWKGKRHCMTSKRHLKAVALRMLADSDSKATAAVSSDNAAAVVAAASAAAVSDAVISNPPTPARAAAAVVLSSLDAARSAAASCV